MFFIGCLQNNLHAQGNDQQVLDSLALRITEQQAGVDHAEITLTTNKSVFIAGDEIWFRAFVLNAVTRKINIDNKFLYVDLVNEKDSVVKLRLLDARNNLLNSRMYIPENLPSGNYWLRAYVSNGLFTDSSGMFVKPLYIYSNIPEAARVKNNKAEDVSQILPAVDFYPEGSSVITGINSVIGLRVTCNNKPIQIKGILRDSRDSVTTSFETDAAGLAKIVFEPSAYRKYNVEINWNGKPITYPLPAFNFYAGQLSVTDQGTFYKLRILLADSIYKKDRKSFIIATARGNVFLKASGTGNYELTVSKKQIPQDIATFYLYDKDLKLISTRSVYVNDNNVALSVTTDKPVYARREKISLKLAVKGKDQQLVPCTMSISVADTLFTAGVIQNSEDQDVVKNIAGNIFYKDQHQVSDSDLDILLLNNAGNNFTNSIGNAFLKPGEEDSNMYIQGTVFNEKNEPSAGRSVLLFSNSGIPVLKTDTTNNAGRFSFTMNSYPDSTAFQFSVKTKNGTATKDHVLLDSFLLPKVVTPENLKEPLILNTSVLQKRLRNFYLNNDELTNHNTTLQNVTVETETKKLNYDVSKRVSLVSAILTSKDFSIKNGGVVNAVMRAPGVLIVEGKIAILGPVMKGREPLLIVDGVEMTNALSAVPQVGEPSGLILFLKQLNPNDIDFIEILKGGDAAMYGVRGGNGVIIINTKTRDFTSDDEVYNHQTFYPRGIAYPVVFQNINYDLPNKKDNNQKDLRSTLYWNGNFVPDKPETTFTFYAGDVPGTYSVTISGISLYGDVIYKTITFQVK